MLTKSVLKNQALQRALAGQSALKPNGWKAKRGLYFTLTLTSLIDAFSILVIFLLSNYSNPGQPLRLDGKMQLPMAARNDSLGAGTVIGVNEGRYFINDKPVSLGELTQRLYEIRQKNPSNGEQGNLIVQADRKTDYASLSPIILAGSHAGFQQFRFAVVQGESVK